MKPSAADAGNLVKLQDGRLFWMRGKDYPLVFDTASRAWVRDPKVTIGLLSDAVPLAGFEIPPLIDAGILSK